MTKVYERGIEKTWSEAGYIDTVVAYVESNPGKSIAEIAVGVSLNEEIVTWAVNTSHELLKKKSEDAVISASDVWDLDISGYIGANAGAYLKILYDDWLNGGRLDLLIDDIKALTNIRRIASGSKTFGAGVTKYLSIDSGTNGAEIIGITIKGVVGADWTLDVYVPTDDAIAAPAADATKIINAYSDRIVLIKYACTKGDGALNGYITDFWDDDQESFVLAEGTGNVAFNGTYEFRQKSQSATSRLKIRNESAAEINIGYSAILF